MSFLPSKIISGGQTGVDRAALDFAIGHDLPYSGHVPKNRWAEDGRIADTYRSLSEIESPDPAERTRMNVITAEAVLVITRGTPDGGTQLTIALAKQHSKPLLVIDLAQETLFQEDLFASCEDFVVERETMIAGPRESKCPGIYAATLDLLERMAKL